MLDGKKIDIPRVDLKKKYIEEKLHGLSGRDEFW